MPNRVKKIGTMLLVTLALTAVTGVALAETRFAVQDPAGTKDVMAVTQEGKIGIGLSVNEDPYNAIHVRGIPGESVGYWQNASILAEGDWGGGFLAYNTNRPTDKDIKLGAVSFGAFDHSVPQQYHPAGMIGFSEAAWSWTQGSLSTPAYLAFYTTPINSASRQERVRITSNGNVGIGISDPGNYRLNVSGAGFVSGGISSSSDIRFKKEIQPITTAVNSVMKLEGVSFKWNIDEFKSKGFPEGRHYGVIAQEAEKVLPEVVNTGADGYKAVAYTEIIPVLIEAIKEQQKQIEELKKKLSELKP